MNNGAFMLRLALSTGCLTLMFAGSGTAGPMPVLPDLPPLPTHYQSQSSDGFYAGILGGYAAGSEDGVGIATVVGHTFAAADLLLGVEVLASAWSRGQVDVEADVRAGFALTDDISVFGIAGLGYSLDAETYASIGTSVELDVGSGWLLRADYRYNRDLDGEEGTHKVMAGLVLRF